METLFASAAIDFHNVVTAAGGAHRICQVSNATLQPLLPLQPLERLRILQQEGPFPLVHTVLLFGGPWGAEDLRGVVGCGPSDRVQDPASGCSGGALDAGTGERSGGAPDAATGGYSSEAPDAATGECCNEASDAVTGECCIEVQDAVTGECCNEVQDAGTGCSDVPTSITVSLSSLPSLRDEALYGMSQWKGITNLTLCVLDGVTDAGLCALCPSNLQCLTLSGLRGITNVGLKHLCSSTVLSTLNLSALYGISDEGLDSLSVGVLTSLSLRDLRGITEAGLECALIKGGLKKLTSLYLGG